MTRFFRLSTAVQAQPSQEEKRNENMTILKFIHMVLGLGALVCSIIAAFNCSFLQMAYTATLQQEYDSEDAEYPPWEEIYPPENREEKMKIGFWRIEDLEACTSGDPPAIHESKGCDSWPDPATKQFDAAWMVGRVMGPLTVSLGAIALLATCTIESNVFKEKYPGLRKRAMGPLIGLHLGLGVCVILLLVGTSSDICNETAYFLDRSYRSYFEFPANGCTLDTGAYMAIVACVLWVGAGLSAFFLYRNEALVTSNVAPEQSKSLSEDEVIALPE
jgi:hypothetical protein